MSCSSCECCGLGLAGRRAAIWSIKAVHSLAFAVIQSAVVYLLYKGLRHQSDRHAALAAAIAIAECAVYAGNGFRCPLTDVAEKLGSEHSAVTDIFLPHWLASNIARIYGPVLTVALVLHVSNLMSKRRRAATPVSQR